ncbi:hypothetical protein MPTK1_2g15070 [Marchantia polymorpha subsp. ruderalis]|uniref:Uncharacterized protein n=1 Tax=Marchantia polymorpha TaxID=3197 RepID=A0A2R6WJV2_MARPO|nr:hypothetical protein MARPO_0082s0004 [Marchantia polymorpha]BBN02401.1 hypothetical protein Mp_2g15070 [Marchantia polymorpha subsp. ruderalis]|eukprot:PTQ34145.1 hypothetical protein MARPO_0082s0004 [Marchantia polymorpha]
MNGVHKKIKTPKNGVTSREHQIILIEQNQWRRHASLTSMLENQNDCYQVTSRAISILELKPKDTDGLNLPILGLPCP